MRDLQAWKKKYDVAFRSGVYDDFSSYMVQLSGQLPIVGCGAFHPEFDVKGRRLQIISRGKGLFDHVTLNLTSVHGCSIVSLGYIADSGGPAEAFVESFREIDDKHKANIAFYLAVEHLENIYFRPSWLDTQPIHVRKELAKRFSSGIGVDGTERTSKSLSVFPITLSELTVTDEFTS